MDLHLQLREENVLCRVMTQVGEDLYLVELKVDGLSAHADIVSDDIQDKGVHSPGCV